MTCVLLVMLACATTSGLRALTFNNPVFSAVDARAEKYVDEGMARAGAAYFIARTINAAVSVIEGTQVHAEPAGVGVSFAVGEALDPLNDMVERFSWVMLLSLTSLGIQKVLIAIGPWLSVNIILPIGLLFLLVHLWAGRRWQFDFRRIGGSLVLVAFLARFAVPVMASLNESVYQTVLHERYVESTEILKTKGDKFDALRLEDDAKVQAIQAQQAQVQPETKEEGGWLSQKWNGAKELVNQTVETGKGMLNFKQKLKEIKGLVAELFDKFVDLVTIFIINTVVLPILFLWMILRLGSLLTGTNFGQGFEDYFKGKILKPTQPVAANLSVEAEAQCEKCGAEMVRRQATKGASAGQWFLVCSKFPGCKNTRPL